jgi:uroporphyrin-III C-methyltransferase
MSVHPAFFDIPESDRNLPAGLVQIVGAGPGDPELLTVKALRALRRAQAVVYDRLVGPEILECLSASARRYDVGKAKGAHSLPQEGINALLAELAGQGLRVVRLKGGDPAVFGRLGEEVDYLRSRGVPVEVIPGITAATACAAAAGVSLTRRGVAQALTLVTAHGRDGDPELDWRALAAPGQTLAVYMGSTRAGWIAERLIAAGLSAATPVLVVEKGSLADERRLPGHLGALEQLVARHGVEAPAMILIGEALGVGAADQWIAESDFPTPAAALAG